MGWETQGIMAQVAAVTAALFAAAILNFTDSRWPRIQEALIGVSFVLAATGGILLLANNPHGSEHLKELLVGQVLWVTYAQLWPVAIVSAVVLAGWFMLNRREWPFGFYALFALAVTQSVQLVGVYLVFASLIIPALATRRVGPRWLRLSCGWGVGLLASFAGLLLSLRLDLPAGAVIVWSLAVIAVAFAWLPLPARFRNDGVAPGIQEK